VNYQKVVSSQIAEIGYDADAQVLGVKFPLKSGGLSEYHYQNVTPSTHRALMKAKDISAYFNENIKKYPNQYPYEKVENGSGQSTGTNRASSAAGSTIGGATVSGRTRSHAGEPEEVLRGSDVQNTAGRDSDGSVTFPNDRTEKHGSGWDNPVGRVQGSLPLGGSDDEGSGRGSALAVIDTMADDIIFTPGAVTDAQIEAGRQWYLAEAKKYDISTEAKRTELKRFARPLQKMRTGIEARAKEITGATKRKIAAIDAEKRRLVQLVGGIEDEVLAHLKAWEQEEEARKIRLARAVKEIEEMVDFTGDSIAIIETKIATLETYDISAMQEYKVGAESAITAVLKRLKAELVNRRELEAQQKELDALRAESAKRAEADRLATVAAEAKAQAEREVAWQVEIDKRRAEDAEQRAKDAEANAKAQADAAVEAERLRNAAIAKAEQDDAEARAADEKHRNEVHQGTISSLLNTGIFDDHANVEYLVDVISKGGILNLTINY
jgi:transposase-like protein